MSGTVDLPYNISLKQKISNALKLCAGFGLFVAVFGTIFWLGVWLPANLLSNGETTVQISDVGFILWSHTFVAGAALLSLGLHLRSRRYLDP